MAIVFANATAKERRESSSSPQRSAPLGQTTPDKRRNEKCKCGNQNETIVSAILDVKSQVIITWKAVSSLNSTQLACLAII